MPVMVFLGTIGLLILSIVLLSINPPRIIFFPKAEPLYINVFVDLPLGSDITATDEVVKDIERRIDRILDAYDEIVESVLTQIGENTADPSGPPEPGASPNKARNTDTFIPPEEQRRNNNGESNNE